MWEVSIDYSQKVDFQNPVTAEKLYLSTTGRIFTASVKIPRHPIMP